MTLTLFVGIWLCSYRITRLITKDSILDRPRKALFRRFPPDPATAKLVNAPRVRQLGVLFACAWCIGFWISGLVVLAVASCTSVEFPVLWWFATSTAVGLTATNLDG